MVLHTAFTGIFYSKMLVSKGILHVLYDKSLFNLACISKLYLGHKKGVIMPGIPCGDCKDWD